MGTGCPGPQPQEEHEHEVVLGPNPRKGDVAFEKNVLQKMLRLWKIKEKT